MRLTRFPRSRSVTYPVLALALLAMVLLGSKCPLGISPQALAELSAAGVDKYLGDFTPVATEDVGDGWTKHTFDPAGGNGPICIAGTPYSVFTRAGDPNKLLIFEQGGGACWQDFYNCNVRAEDQAPPDPDPQGIWDFENPDNPYKDHSIVYLPYCDGSVFAGDNDVLDPAWQAFIEDALELPPGAGPPIRFHRGLRNQSAGMDVAKATFPDAKKITLAGSSAGGVGVAGFAPFLVRFLYGNAVNLAVFNDAGPVAVTLDQVDDIADRANDWQFDQFYPASCTECSAFGQATEVIAWRLENDRTIREAFYETDADLTNRFFLGFPSQQEYRDIILTEHGALHEAFPLRYKRFIVSGDGSHTALQTPLFYTQTANGFPLDDWTTFFEYLPLFWVDLVEDFVAFP